MCIGNSHITGFTNVVKSLVSNIFEIYCVLKPGSSSIHLNGTASQEIKEIESGWYFNNLLWYKWPSNQ